MSITEKKGKIISPISQTSEKYDKIYQVAKKDGKSPNSIDRQEKRGMKTLYGQHK